MALDPQVQIKTMEIALAWANSQVTSSASIGMRSKHFDEAYKALVKTLAEAHANPAKAT